MLDLLSKYSVGEIIIFIIILSLGVKQFIELVDWFKNKFSKNANKTLNEKERNQKIDEKLTQYSASLQQINEDMQDFKCKLKILMDSDKDDIKSYIVKEHHYFCYKVGWIDDQSMDCLERRYEHYVDENGNSYVKGLMEQLRALPRAPR